MPQLFSRLLHWERGVLLCVIYSTSQLLDMFQFTSMPNTVSSASTLEAYRSITI